MDVYPLDNQVGKAELFPKRPHVLLFLMPPGHGKSTIILNMLLRKEAYQGQFDNIFVFSSNFFSDEKQMMLLNHAVLRGNKPVPEEYVFTRYDPEKIKEIVSGLTKEKKTLFLFDDLAMKVSGDPFMQEILINRRHKNLTVWITGQRLKLFSKALRTMSDSWVVSSLSTTAERREAFDDIAGQYGITQTEFNDILDHVARSPFGFFYANGSTMYNKFSEEFIIGNEL
jgi:hypothetical protein